MQRALKTLTKTSYAEKRGNDIGNSLPTKVSVVLCPDEEREDMSLTKSQKASLIY